MATSHRPHAVILLAALTAMISCGAHAQSAKPDVKFDANGIALKIEKAIAAGNKGSAPAKTRLVLESAGGIG
jgi:hypothetical protein